MGFICAIENLRICSVDFLTVFCLFVRCVCVLELSVVFFELYPVTFHSLFHVKVLSFSVAT